MHVCASMSTTDKSQISEHLEMRIWAATWDTLKISMLGTAIGSVSVDPGLIVEENVAP